MTLCNALAQGNQNSGAVAVLNVNYRHTPEHRFPSQIFDAWAVFNFAREGHLLEKYNIDHDRIILGGTSAGAAIAIAAALHEMRRAQQANLSFDQRGKSRKSSIRGLVLSSSPTVHPDLFPYSRLRSRGVASHEQFQNTGILPGAVARRFYSMYLPEANYETKCHEWVSPLLVSDQILGGNLWPPISIHIAGADAFRDEGFLFAEKLRELGVDVRERIHSGYGHAFERFPQLEESGRWRSQVVEDIQSFLR
jgi:acetyl esterase/lipase